MLQHILRNHRILLWAALLLVVPACAVPPLAPWLYPPTAISPTGCTATWTPVTGATSYTIQVAQDGASFNSIVQTVSGITGTTVQLVVPNLRANYQSCLRVQAVNADGASGYSNTGLFATFPQPVLEPATAITATGFTANWICVPNTAAHMVEVATDSALQHVIQKAGSGGSPVGGQPQSLAIGGLQPATTYYYSVYGLMSNGCIGSPTAVGVAVTTLPSSAAPATPGTPSCISLGQTGCTVLWNAVPSATSYTVEVATSSAFGSTVVQSLPEVWGTSIVVDQLVPQTTYYVHVCAASSNGVSPFSNWITVTTPATPTGYVAGQGAGFRADYYTTNTVGTFQQWLMSRTEPQINFSYAQGGSPVPGVVPIGCFGIRFTGQFVAPSTGAYQFYLTSDDGARLYLNGIKYIDDWTAHAAVTDVTPALSLVAGQSYPFMVEYWAGGYPPSVLQCLYSGPGTGGPVVIPDSQCLVAPSAITLSSATVPVGPVGQTVGTLATVGGTAPYTYTLVSGAGSTDNALFAITGTTLNTAAANLSGFYSIRLRSTDSLGAYLEQIIPLGGAPIAAAATSVVAGQSFTANWQPMTGAVRYELLVATDPNCTNIVASYNGLTGASQLVSGLQNSAYYYEVLAYSASGSQSAPSNIITVVTPSNVPNAPVLTAPTNLSASGVTVNWTAPSGGASSYLLQVSTNVNFSSIYTEAHNILTTSCVIGGLLPNTSYYFQVAGGNAAGTGAYSASSSVLTLPAAPVATAATLLSATGATANWLAPAGGASSYILQYSTDPLLVTGVSTVTGITGTSYAISALTSGCPYYYQVASVNAKLTSAYSNVVTLTTIDTIPPVAQITGPANNALCNTSTVAVSWSGSDNLTPTANLVYSWQLDSGAWSAFAAATTTTLTALANGAHSVQVKARDAAGNVSTPASATFTIDTVPPVVQLTAPANNALGNSSTVAVSWCGSDNLTPAANLVYSRQLDNGNWSAFAAATTSTLTQLADGTHTVLVKARDAAGNVSTPASVTFTIDTAVPETTITSPADNTLCNTSSVTVAWSGSENQLPVAGLGYSWQLDNGAWSSVSAATSTKLTGLANGTYTFQVLACDAAGNVEATPASVTFTIDTIPPVTQISSPTNNASLNTNNVTVTWSGSDNLTPSAKLVYSCQVDGGAWSSFTAATTGTLTTLTQGAHTVKVIARDAAGNLSTPAGVTFTVACVPTTTITSGPANNSDINTTTVSFGWTGTDTLTATANLVYSWQLDSGSWSAWGPLTSTRFTSLAAGAHSFTVKAKDALGNIDPTPPTCSFSIDLLPPTVTILTPAEMALNNQNGIAASWTGSDNVTPTAALQYSYQVDGWTWSAWSTTTSVALGNLSNGVHTLYVKARDAAGNVTPVPASRDFELDYYAPQAQITGVPANNSTVNSTTVTLSWAGTDNLTPTASLRFSWLLDNGNWSAWSATTTNTLTNLSAGYHRFSVVAMDLAGNVSTTPAITNFKVVLTPGA